jgi:predicted acylesterase/phospholipase RssA
MNDIVCSERTQFVKHLKNELIQSRYDSIDHLVFGGGGIKGMAFASCLFELCNRDNKNWFYLLSKIKRISATSAGTVMGLLCCLGIPYEKIKKLVYELDLSKLLPSDFKCNWQMMVDFTFGPGFGLLKSEFIENFYKILFKAVGLKEDITFLELFAKTRILLEFWAVDVLNVEIQSFSYQTHPNLSVVKAMTASSSIPFIFSMTEIDGKKYTDGGVMMNIPISNLNPENTLVFTLQTKPEKFSTVIGFSQNILLSMSNAQLNNVIVKCPRFGLNLVKIDASEISFFDIFVSSSEQQLKLWKMSKECGKQAAQVFDGMYLLLLLYFVRLRCKNYEWKI